ncbi:MAG: amidohydrolase family protein [Bacteroidales bacterium]
MKRFSAHYIFIGDGSAPLKNGIVEIDDNGVITDIIEGRDGVEVAHTQFLNGIITPGFVNAHCHLELSHMTPQIIREKGLTGFVKGMIANRSNYAEQEVVAGVIRADKTMFDNGIVAVGDIANTATTISVKRESKIYYHTFCEALGIDSNAAEDVLQQVSMLSKWFGMSGLPFSIVPHAPYSVSKDLFSRLFAEDFKISSLHLAESKAEREFYTSHSGEMWDFIKNIKIPIPSDFNIEKLSAVDFLLQLLPKDKSMLFVHNTDLRKDEYQKLMNHFDDDNKPYFCTCPNSNLIIEGKLPDYNILNDNVCIGTDSLASNHGLSILEEMKTIAKHAPHIELNELVKWASDNGAQALKIDDRFGAIAIGKTCGLNFIDGIDFENLSLTNASTVKPLN